MAKIEKREVVLTPPPVEYVLTLSQKELDVLTTLRYYFLGGRSEVRDSLDDVFREHGRVHTEWCTSGGVWPTNEEV